MSACEIRSQSFPSLELVSVDERASIAAPSSRKPGQRAFGFIVNNCGAAKFSDQLALLQHKMLGAKMIDNRLLLWGRNLWFSFRTTSSVLGFAMGHWRPPM
jgi:hypothetical protein